MGGARRSSLVMVLFSSNSILVRSLAGSNEVFPYLVVDRG